MKNLRNAIRMSSGQEASPMPVGAGATSFTPPYEPRTPPDYSQPEGARTPPLFEPRTPPEYPTPPQGAAYYGGEPLTPPEPLP